MTRVQEKGRYDDVESLECNPIWSFSPSRTFFLISFIVTLMYDFCQCHLWKHCLSKMVKGNIGKKKERLTVCVIQYISDVSR